MITKIKNIENIIRDDLEYSLYFDLFSDTSSFNELANQTIILKGSGTSSELSIICEDFVSREKIVEKNYQLNDDIRAVAHEISDDIIEFLVGEKGIASTKIAFSYKTTRGKELAMIDYDAFNFTPLTKNGTQLSMQHHM